MNYERFEIPYCTGLICCVINFSSACSSSSKIVGEVACASSVFTW